MKRKVLTITSLCLLGFAGTGQATTQGILEHNIPAASCQPADLESTQMLILYSRGWRFRTNAVGSARLYCTLPLSYLKGDLIANNNDITLMRMAYTDPDGQGVNARVYSCLYKTSTPGPVNWYCNIDSNNSAITVPTQQWNSNVDHDLDIYSFEGAYVSISRTGPNIHPVFTGIDFLPPLIVPIDPVIEIP